MIAPGLERAVERGPLVARVEDAPDLRGDGGVDGGPVQAHGVAGRVVRRHEQQLVGALEGGRQRGRVGVITVPHRHPAVGEPLGLGDVARHDGDVPGGETFEQVIDGRAVQRAGGSGDDEHVSSQVISAIRISR